MPAQRNQNNVRLHFVITGIENATGAVTNLNQKIRALRSRTGSQIKSQAREAWVPKAQPHIQAVRGANADLRTYASQRPQLVEQFREAQRQSAIASGRYKSSFNRWAEKDIGGKSLRDFLANTGMTGGKANNLLSQLFNANVSGQENGTSKVLRRYMQALSPQQMGTITRMVGTKERGQLTGNAKKQQDALNNAKKQELALQKQINDLDEKSKNTLMLKGKHQAAIVAMKRQEEAKLLEEKRLQEEALQAQKQLLRDISQQWGSLVFIAQNFVTAIENALEKTRQFREASILARQSFSEDAFRTTAFGMDAFQVGQSYKAISRSAYPNEFKNKIEQFGMFERLFNVEPNQLIPMVSGFKSMYGKGNTSTQKILDQMLATSASSSFDFSGWASITMQGAIPTLNDLNISLEQTSALLAGISNLGGGPFASGFGLSGITQLAAPTEKMQKVLSSIGIGPGKSSEMIRSNGILSFMETLNGELSKMDDASRDKAITDLFPSMTKGVGLMILNNLNMFKELESKYKNPYFYKSVLLESKDLPVNKVKEISALMSNIGAQFTEIVMGSPLIKAIMETIITTLKSVSSALTAINQSPFFKFLIGGAVGIWAMVKAYKTLIPLIKLTTAALAKQSLIEGGGGMLSKVAGANIKFVSPLATKAAAAMPQILSSMSYIGLTLGAILLAVNFVRGIFKARAEAAQVKFANQMSILEQLYAKKKAGNLTPEELAKIEAQINAIIFGAKNGKRKMDINITVDVGGNTIGVEPTTVARAIGDEVEDRLYKVLSPMAAS